MYSLISPLTHCLLTYFVTHVWAAWYRSWTVRFCNRAQENMVFREGDPHLLIQSVHVLLEHEGLSYSDGILSFITLLRFGKVNTLWHTTDPRWQVTAPTPQRYDCFQFDWQGLWPGMSPG